MARHRERGQLQRDGRSDPLTDSEATWLRRAGHGLAADGADVTWSVAEGRRGRRWREVVRAGEGIRSSLLLELDREGRFSHLELSTAAGLLTLHPESDGTLHGNAVTSKGIEHIRGLPWSSDVQIALEGSPVCAAIAASHGARQHEALRIGIDLSLSRGRVAADPRDATADGLPSLANGTSWPLEEGA